MLRAAVKHGISRALSAHRGFEVWDFDIKQENEEGTASLELRYRYHRKFLFRATIEPRSPDRSRPEYEMAVEVVPGELGHRESFELSTLGELYAAIERWTGRLEGELLLRLVGACEPAPAFVVERTDDPPALQVAERSPDLAGLVLPGSRREQDVSELPARPGRGEELVLAVRPRFERRAVELPGGLARAQSR